MRGELKKPKYHYILVFTNNGPVFVTDVKTTPYKHCVWNKKEKPYSFLEQKYAQEVCFGLNVNGYQCVQVESQWELENHMYNYELGNFYWRKKKNK